MTIQLSNIEHARTILSIELNNNMKTRNCSEIESLKFNKLCELIGYFDNYTKLLKDPYKYIKICKLENPEKDKL
jgi:hypothetical protein